MATNVANTPIAEGWWTPGKTGKKRARWVLRVADGMVYYGTGGTIHKFCKVETFQRWVRNAAARLQESAK